MDIYQAITAYSRLVESVFSEKKVISASGSGTFKATKLEEELKRIVREATGDENTLMMKKQQNEGECKVYVKHVGWVVSELTSYVDSMVFAMSEHNLNASTPRIFRSYQGPNNQMPNCPIWQVLRATMAHPDLFKGVEVGESSGTLESLIGGDVGCSNPTPHVLAEISALYPERRVASIVCIGAGHASTIQIPKSNPLHRIMPINVLVAMKNIATDSERVAQEMEARFQDTANVYFRFRVDQGMQNVRMSHWQRQGEVVASTRNYMQKAEVTRTMEHAVQAIVARRGALHAANIGGKAHQSSVQQATGVKRCPAPSSAFTGREPQVQQILNCLLSPNHERRICVVHGLGGSGKTQLALKAIEQSRGSWTDIVYVDATTRETLHSTLKGFALARKIGETHEDAIRWLESSPRPWLLVFDNADDPDLGLPKFIPGGSHGSVLITTRLRTLITLGRPHGPGSSCAVGGMDAEEGLELLLKKAHMQEQVLSGEEVDAAINLVKDLGYLALAIVQAGAYILCTQINISKYRKQCLEHTRAALERYSELLGNIEEYEKTVYTTWVMSYERLKPRTQQLLGLMAHLHHGGITEDIFRRATSNREREQVIPPDEEEASSWKYVRDYLTTFLDPDEGWDSNVFSSTVDELLLYSLVDYDRVNEAYTLHVLVQDWACTVIPNQRLTGLKYASHLLALSVSLSDNTSEEQTYRRGLVLHAKRIEDKLGVVDANDAAFFAEVYKENGQWREEGRIWRHVVDARKQALGELHPDTLTSMNNLASTYSNQGRWNEAEALQMQVLHARKQTLGELHSDTLTSMNNLALTYQNQGRWNDAEALQVQVLDEKKQTLGELHPDTLTSTNNLSLTYQNQGRWSEAEALQVQVLDARRQTLGELHPDTLTSVSSLASTYWKQGRWNEAEALEVQVLDARKQTLGEHHPDTLTSMHNLGRTYFDQGRWDEAEALQAQVVAAGKRVFGEGHHYTPHLMTALAATYRKQGRRCRRELEALEAEIKRLEAK
ncbi:hypothetical protein FRC10_010991 [Ceratobasidium sp. 414]|nr:hypothetical protein FRC10_010991 [Ceratobasidium sp. 414]